MATVASSPDLPQPDYSQAGVARDGDVSADTVRTTVASLSTAIAAVFALEGRSAAAGVTDVPLAFGGGEPLAFDDIGVPVSSQMDLDTVSVSWLSDTAPAGDWTLTFYRRSDAGTMNAQATFAVTTS